MHRLFQLLEHSAPFGDSKVLLVCVEMPLYLTSAWMTHFKWWVTVRGKKKHGCVCFLSVSDGSHWSHFRPVFIVLLPALCDVRWPWALCSINYQRLRVTRVRLLLADLKSKQKQVRLTVVSEVWWRQQLFNRSGRKQNAADWKHLLQLHGHCQSSQVHASEETLVMMRRLYSCCLHTPLGNIHVPVVQLLKCNTEARRNRFQRFRWFWKLPDQSCDVRFSWLN